LSQQFRIDFETMFFVHSQQSGSGLGPGPEPEGTTKSKIKFLGKFPPKAPIPNLEIPVMVRLAQLLSKYGNALQEMRVNDQIGLVQDLCQEIFKVEEVLHHYEVISQYDST
jgi:hypothetical protein